MKYKSSVIIILVISILFLITYFIPSLKKENSENRTLASFNMIFNPNKDSITYRNTPIERLEVALEDQFAFRESFNKDFLNIFNLLDNLTYKIIRLFKEKKDNQYTLHSIGKYELIDDTNYLTDFPEVNEMDKSLVKKHIEQIDYLQKKYPNIKQYVYYVTQAFDTSWFDDYLGITSANHYQEIKSSLPTYVKSNQLIYKDLNDYMKIHYKTDHHWNHLGANRGYEDIYNMMKNDFNLDEIKKPISIENVSEKYDFKYLGSYGRKLNKLYNGGYDDFSFYNYNLSNKDLYVLDPNTKKEIKVIRMGLYDEYIKGIIKKSIEIDHYVTMYGTAQDINNNYSDGIYPFIIKNNNNKKNLLIVGDSYNRAIRDVLASHFNTTVYLDYRILSKIPIDYLIEKYNIDALLISSNTSLWNNKDYFFTFKEDE